MPHHVTQRDNRREQTFFDEDDYAVGGWHGWLAQPCRRTAGQVSSATRAIARIDLLSEKLAKSPQISGFSGVERRRELDDECVEQVCRFTGVIRDWRRATDTIRANVTLSRSYADSARWPSLRNLVCFWC